ncbi:MAG TPA: hypothetical protein VFR74_03615 [Jiangellales bacterium]|nr:hypothetical protein [Jiangellales bacterium]
MASARLSRSCPNAAAAVSRQPTQLQRSALDLARLGDVAPVDSRAPPETAAGLLDLDVTAIVDGCGLVSVGTPRMPEWRCHAVADSVAPSQ